MPSAATPCVPSITARRAALLRLDIVAFTELTDRVVRSGLAGAEDLAAFINERLEEVRLAAAENGGELVVLAGDAVLMAWFVEADADLKQPIVLAIKTALSIQSKSESWSLFSAAVRIRASVGSGSLRQLVVGGLGNEWYPVLFGPALADAVKSGFTAQTGQTVVAADAWKLAKPLCVGTTTDRQEGIVRRLTESALRRFAGAAAIPQAAPPTVISPNPNNNVKNPPAIPWAGEFRTASIVFVAVKFAEYAADNDALASHQEIVRRIQSCTIQFGGHIHQVRFDEEGLTTVCAFGLPPHSHEDNRLRAVQVALALNRDFSELGVTTSTGIATGKVFWASIMQSGTGRLTTLVGPAVNLAARLMQLNAGVVCDDHTVAAARSRSAILARKLAPMRIKGKLTPIEAYVPYGIGKREDAQDLDVISPIVRSGELASIAAALPGGAKHTGGVIVLEGEAGVGKSTLVGKIVDLCRGKEVDCIVSYAEELQSNLPFSAWRDLFVHLFGLEGYAASRLANVDRLIKVLGPQAQLAPLLNDVLGLALSDNAATLQMQGEVRAAATRRLLIERLGKVAAVRPLVVVLEDGHCLDSSSSALLRAVANEKMPLLLIVTARPPAAGTEPITKLMAARRVHKIVLSNFDVAETGALMSSILKADVTEPDAAELVLGLTDGNPLFIEEVLPALTTSGILLATSDRIKLAMPIAAAQESVWRLFGSLGTPATLEDVVLARVDRLPADEKTLLRLASVVGKSIAVSDLTKLVQHIGDSELSELMASLEERGILVRDKGAETYNFRHAALRDVVYASLSFAERRQLHKAVGEMIEATLDSADPRVITTLARHFGESDVPERSIPYSLEAARSALKGFANIEAVNLSTKALEILRKHSRNARSARPPRAQQAEFELILGRANHWLSRYGEARRHAEAALELIGFPVPSRQSYLVVALLGQIILQAWHRRFPAIGLKYGEAPRANATKAAAALEYLADVYFFSDDGLRAGYAAIRMLNLSERAHYHAGMALGFANLAGMCDVARFSRIADNYRARSLGQLPQVSDAHARIWTPALVASTLVGRGRWSEAEQLLDQSRLAALNADDQRSLSVAVEQLGIIDGCRGRWRAALKHAHEALAVAEKEKDRRMQVAVLREQGYLLLQLGDLDAAESVRARIEQEFDRGLTAEERATRIEIKALAATIHVERGRIDEANRDAHEALALASQSNLTLPTSYWPAFLVARVFLNLSSSTRRKNDAHTASSRTAARVLARHARTWPIAEPAAAIVNGWLSMLLGRPAQAARYWAKAKSQAQTLEMSYELGLSQAALGQRSPTTVTAARPAGLQILVGAPTRA